MCIGRCGLGSTCSPRWSDGCSRSCHRCSTGRSRPKPGGLRARRTRGPPRPTETPAARLRSAPRQQQGCLLDSTRRFWLSASTKPSVARACANFRKLLEGRTSRDDSRLIAHSLYSGCPGARHPFGAGLNPARQAQRVALGFGAALRLLKCAAARREIAQLGGFARVADGVARRPVRSEARGG